MTTVSIPNYFDRNAPQYKCCCQSCHVTTGTIVVAVLEVIGLIAAAIQLNKIINNPGSVPHYDLVVAIQAVIIAICVIGLICLFVGLSQQKAAPILVYLITRGLFIVAAVVAFIGSIVLMTQLNSRFAYADAVTIHYARKQYIYRIAAYALAIALGIWFFLVVIITEIDVRITSDTTVIGCYRFFRDQTEAKRHNCTMMMNNPIQGMASPVIIQTQVPAFLVQTQAPPVMVQPQQPPPPPYSGMAKE